MRVITKDKRIDLIDPTHVRFNAVLEYLKNEFADTRIYTITYLQKIPQFPVSRNLDELKQSFNEKWLKYITAYQTSIVQFAYPLPVIASSTREAIDMIWPHHIFADSELNIMEIYSGGPTEHFCSNPRIIK